jgi:hypothetical protein
VADATGAVTATTALGRGIFPGRVRPRGDRRLRRRGRHGADRDGGRRGGVRRGTQPVHDALRRPVRSGHPRRAGRHRSRRDAPARRRLHPRGRAPRRRSPVRRAGPEGCRAQRLARARGHRRVRARESGDPLAPDGRLDPRSVAERIGELLESAPPPATASSSPTAATSSAGRTCTGRSPRPTA